MTPNEINPNRKQTGDNGDSGSQVVQVSLTILTFMSEFGLFLFNWQKVNWLCL